MIFSAELNVGLRKTTNFKLPVPVIISTTIVEGLLKFLHFFAALIYREPVTPSACGWSYNLQVPYISGNTAAKFQLKIMTTTRYPPGNDILCMHLNNSTSKLRSNTWLSPTRFLKLNDYFHLFYNKSNKLLRYSEFSILL